MRKSLPSFFSSPLCIPLSLCPSVCLSFFLLLAKVGHVLVHSSQCFYSLSLLDMTSLSEISFLLRDGK